MLNGFKNITMQWGLTERKGKKKNNAPTSEKVDRNKDQLTGHVYAPI